MVFKPERLDEIAKLEEIYKFIIDCVRFNKKLVLIGKYVPLKNNMVRFIIEGESSGKTFAEEYVDTEHSATHAINMS